MSAHAGHSPSRKAQELADHLKQEIAAFRLRDAKVSDTDVKMAVTLLQPSSGGELPVALAILAGIVGIFFTVGLGIAAAKGRMGGDGAVFFYVSSALLVTGAVVATLLARTRS